MAFVILLAWVAVISVVTWVAFARDKAAAEAGEWRTPERTLLTLAAIGGTPGAFAAQRMLRHKTRKQPFATFLILIAVAQVVLLAALAMPIFSEVLFGAIAHQLH